MEKKIEGALTPERVEAIYKDYGKCKKNNILRHALSRSALTDVIFDPASENLSIMEFNVVVPTLPVCDQKNSGRCWIFAGLNVLREIVAKKCNLKEFELSQNYISLYDKIEKANFALESVITLVGRDHDDRELAHILKEPVSDGGQWDMFVNLVKKYGLMPQNAFPETYQSEHTHDTDFLVNAIIRNFASTANKLHTEGKDEEIRPLKDKKMCDIYKMFLNSFGVPPTTFNFEYTDKEDKYHIEENLTPIEFFEKYIGDEIDAYQSLINSPTKEKPFNKNYTIEFLGNVVEGAPINHLNVDMERMKELIVKQLQAGCPVWFGSDVSFYRDRSTHSWNKSAFDYLTPFDNNIEFDKAEMLDYWHSAMNHAMVITGVNLDKNGKPTRWKIENSWGEKNGSKGYFAMDAEWFDTFVYQAVIKKELLNEEELNATKQEPTPLHPWDPMGTLAK